MIIRSVISIAGTLALGVLALLAPLANAAPVSGAIFTTDSTCSGVDLNIYVSKQDVYVDGGPAHPGAAGLPDGFYYVQITDPSGGIVLGTSVGTLSPTPIHVTNGEFDQCYQLWAILVNPSDGNSTGYADTPNPGGEYKVWISTEASFTNSQTKTDNFKVKSGTSEDDVALINVRKCYDVNLTGNCDSYSASSFISGWKVNIRDGINNDRFTPVSIVVAAPDNYTVSEYDTIETNWIHTSPTVVGPFHLNVGDTKTVDFANVCVGPGGGLTLGFWSNKNGQALFGADDLALMVALNLRNANGSAFDPAGYSAFRTWLLNATATNMAYMLSAQLAAMELNVNNNFVNVNALVYAPGTSSANGFGFATVGALMLEANTELGVHGTALSGDAWRTYQESLKTALDNANNNKTFLQASPCAFSFL